MTGRGWTIRPLAAGDRAEVITEVAAWTPRVDAGALLPPGMFDHFADTSLIIHDAQGSLAGFVIALLPDGPQGPGYIHLVWVSPQHRRAGVATQLYARVFDLLRARGARRVEAATAAANHGALEFHRALGFQAEPDGAGSAVAGGTVMLRRDL